MQLSLVSLIVLVVAPLAPLIVQATPAPAPAPAPEPWRDSPSVQAWKPKPVPGYDWTTMSGYDDGDDDDDDDDDNEGVAIGRMNRGSSFINTGHDNNKDRYKPLGDSTRKKTVNPPKQGSSNTKQLFHDSKYSNVRQSMDQTICSGGKNGLTSTWPLLNQVPTFPWLLAGPDIEGRNSGRCGRCYEISYKGITKYAMLVDRASKWVLSEKAFDTLTKSHGGKRPGSVKVQMKLLKDRYKCDPRHQHKI